MKRNLSHLKTRWSRGVGQEAIKEKEDPEGIEERRVEVTQIEIQIEEEEIDLVIGVIEGINERNNRNTDIQAAVEKTALVKSTEDLQVAQNEESIEGVVKNVSEKGEVNVIRVIQQVQVEAKAKPEAKRKKREKRRRKSILNKTERNLEKFRMKRW